MLDYDGGGTIGRSARGSSETRAETWAEMRYIPSFIGHRGLWESMPFFGLGLTEQKAPSSEGTVGFN